VGAFDPSLLPLRKLTYLSFAGAGINGSMGPAPFLYTSLQFLDLSGTQLRGSLPSDLGLLSALTQLSVPLTLQCPPPPAPPRPSHAAAPSAPAALPSAPPAPPAASRGQGPSWPSSARPRELPGTWDPNSLEGVTSQYGRIQGISVHPGAPQDPIGALTLDRRLGRRKAPFSGGELHSSP